MFAQQARHGRIDTTEVYDILRNDRRRWVLEYLKERLEPISLRMLSERIAEREAGETPAPRKLRQSVYNSLHQTHLPKLNEIGVIDYDKDRKTVELCDRARTIDVYMDIVSPFGITWRTYYRTIGIVALATVVLSATDLVVFVQFKPVLFATVFLFVYALSTAYQVWSRRWFYLRGLFEGE